MVTGRNVALALAALEEKRWSMAADYARAAIAEGYKPALEILATAAWRAGNLKAALETVEAIETRGPTATAMTARLNLLAGDQKRGWQLIFDACRSGTFGPSPYELPRWNGEDLAGRRVVAWGVGLGDDIFFARYLPKLAATGAEVCVNCRPSLVRLFQSISGVAEVRSIYEETPGAEFQIQPAELPVLLGEYGGQGDAAYLHAEPAKNPSTGRMRVGLAWASGSGHYEAEDRSVTLADMAPLAEVADIQFLGMQFGRPSMQRTTPPAGMQIEEAGQGDFAETASVIATLDLFITVDTAIANLAGALHAPTWVAVPFVADWRWGADGERTPWYPSARVYRQPSPNDWKSVFRRMSSDLSAGQVSIDRRRLNGRMSVHTRSM